MNDSNVSRRDDAGGAPVVNLPNALTVGRLVLVPVFVGLMLVEGAPARWWALIVFCLAAATDQLDGYIARSRHLVTDFGRLTDPIADKALTLGAFVMLSVAGLVPWWFTVLIAVRELGITVLRALLLRRGIVVSANKGGKVKTLAQMLFIVVMLVPWTSLLAGAGLTVRGGLPDPVFWVGWTIGAVALGLTLWSGAVYCLEGWRLWHADPAQASRQA